MRQFIKENIIPLLFLLFLGLLMIFWGRLVVREIHMNTYNCRLNTLEERLACLESYGWEADPNSETEEKMMIPDTFSEAYRRYNQLQRGCGFNLEVYKGKTVRRYSYLVYNAPYRVLEPIQVHLLVYEGTLIGGDCTSGVAGRILPLKRNGVN